MSNVVNINEVQQPATFPLTVVQQCDIACELEERITDAFEILDVDIEDEKAQRFLQRSR